MPKYRDYFRQMSAENEQLFIDFAKVHDLYKKDRKKYQKQFDTVGKEVVRIVTAWESKLCKTMEGGQNSVYSVKLAEKFKAEVKAFFPLIDFVGAKISSQ